HRSDMRVALCCCASASAGSPRMYASRASSRMHCKKVAKPTSTGVTLMNRFVFDRKCLEYDDENGSRAELKESRREQKRFVGDANNIQIAGSNLDTTKTL